MVTFRAERTVHSAIVDFYASVRGLGASQFYEPSDWQFARVTLNFANKLIQSARPSTQMLAAVNAALTELLVREGARRRVRLEIEREQTTATVIDIAKMFRQQVSFQAAPVALGSSGSIRSEATTGPISTRASCAALCTSSFSGRAAEYV